MVGECVPGVFDWFGELWELSGCCGIKCNGIAYEENKSTKKFKRVERNNE